MKRNLYYSSIISISIQILLVTSSCGSPQAAQLAATQTSLALTQQALSQTEAVLPTKPAPGEQTEAAAVATERFKITQRGISQTQEDTIVTNTAEEVLSSQTTQESSDIIATKQADLLTNLVWKADFVKSDLSEFDGQWGIEHQGISGMYNFITSGYLNNYAISLSIHTTKPSETGAHAAYLFVNDQLMLNSDYYYSAWYNIPGGIKTKDWWSIWQWKSTFDGNDTNSKPVFALDMSASSQVNKLNLYFRPDMDDLSIKKRFIQNKHFPNDQLVHIESFYKRSTGNDGQVFIWQDEEDIFNITGLPTILADGSVY